MPSRLSVLTSLLVHSAVFSAATWVGDRRERLAPAWAPSGPPMAALVEAGDTPPEAAPVDAPVPDADWPALPTPADAAVPLPEDPPPLDDSVEQAPTDVPDVAPPRLVPPPRDWDAITGAFARRVRPRVEALVPPAPVHQPAPERPPAARHRTGTVLLRVLVAPDGMVGDVRVHESSGVPALDAAAARAAFTWRFRPAARAGVAVAAWVEIPVRF